MVISHDAGWLLPIDDPYQEENGHLSRPEGTSSPGGGTGDTFVDEKVSKMYFRLTKDLALYKQKLSRSKGELELTSIKPNLYKTTISVRFDDSLNQVHEVESYKKYNVLKDEDEDCCEMLCKVQ